MSCAIYSELLTLDARDREAQIAPLAEHLLRCGDCARLGQLGWVATVVRSNTLPEQSPAQRARAWKRIAEAGRRRAPARSWLPVAAVAAAAAMVIGALLTHPLREETPASHAVELRAGEVVKIAGGTLRATRGSMVRVDAELRSLVLERGAIEVDVALAMPPPVEVTTVGSRIRVLASALKIEIAGEQTELEVLRGSAEVASKGGPWKTISAPEVRATAGREAPQEPASLVREETPRIERALRALSPAAVGPPEPRDRQEIEEARALLGRDDDRAGELARSVLERKPDPQTEALALVIAADADRRRGRLEEALVQYAQVSRHPRGEALAEEALYHQASILRQLGRGREALAALGEARDRFRPGALLPERTALDARLLLERGAAAAAADRLDEAASSDDLVLDRARLDTAKLLALRDPARARSIALLVAGRAGALRVEAQAILREVDDEEVPGGARLNR